MKHGISVPVYVHHTALFTKDFAVSIPWWEKMFGLELVYQKAHELPKGRVNMAWLKGPNLYLELFEHPDDCVAQPEEAYWGYWGCKHICFAAEDEDYGGYSQQS